MLDIAPPPASGYSANDKEELGAAAGYGVQAAVHLMSTHSFSDAILWLLDLADPAIQARALALLRTRLPTIKASRRAEISPAVVTVVDRIRALLAESAIDSEGALETLNAVASSIFPEEDASLAKTVPELMAVARSSANPKSTRAAAIGILTKLTLVLSLGRLDLPSSVTNAIVTHTGTASDLVLSLWHPSSFLSPSRCSRRRLKVSRPPARCLYQR